MGWETGPYLENFAEEGLVFQFRRIRIDTIISKFLHDSKVGVIDLDHFRILLELSFTVASSFILSLYNDIASANGELPSQADSTVTSRLFRINWMAFEPGYKCHRRFVPIEEVDRSSAI